MTTRARGWDRWRDFNPAQHGSIPCAPAADLVCFEEAAPVSETAWRALEVTDSNRQAPNARAISDTRRRFGTHLDRTRFTQVAFELWLREAFQLAPDRVREYLKTLTPHALLELFATAHAAGFSSGLQYVLLQDRIEEHRSAVAAMKAGPDHPPVDNVKESEHALNTQEPHHLDAPTSESPVI